MDYNNIEKLKEWTRNMCWNYIDSKTFYTSYLSTQYILFGGCGVSRRQTGVTITQELYIN